MSVFMLLVMVLTMGSGYCSTPLLDAVKSGDPAQVQPLLEAGANVDIQDEKGKTALLIAMESGNFLLGQQLIAWAADVNMADDWGNTPLLAAARRMDTNSMAVLLNVKADPDTANQNGITPLIASTQKDNSDGVKLLIDGGANINYQDRLGRTALIWAVIRRNEDTTKLLLNHSADATIVDQDNLTALAYAEKAESQPIIALLDERAAQTTGSNGQRSMESCTKYVDKNHVFSPVIDAGCLQIGNATAPVTIVEYTDLQCPYCAAGLNLMKAVVAKYGDKVRIIIKNNPLLAHRQALMAALYFEAVVQEDPNKGLEFQEMVFASQGELTAGESFLKEVAKEVGADPVKLEQDVHGELVRSIVTKDLEEADQFHFDGVPVFVVNGIAVKGMLPAEEMFKIIDGALVGRDKSK